MQKTKGRSNMTMLIYSWIEKLNQTVLHFLKAVFGKKHKLVEQIIAVIKR